LRQALLALGGNLTGVATLVPGNFGGKTLGILRELLPQAKRVAAFINPSKRDPSAGVSQGVTTLRPPSSAFSSTLSRYAKLGKFLAQLPPPKLEGRKLCTYLGDSIFNSPPNRVPDLAAQAGLPAVYLAAPPELVQAGGLISYGPDFLALARRGAHYIDRILKGAKPADLPIEQPSKFLLVINLRTAKSLGLDIPASLLARADEVIE
jgi:putative ABC transport system substrate-binding protein